MHVSLLVLGSLVLAGCATVVSKPPASEAEKDRANNLYISCLHDQARRADDGISDALTIGAAIAPLCRSYMESVAETATRGQRFQVYQLVYQRRLAAEANVAAAAVLTERSNRRR